MIQSPRAIKGLLKIERMSKGLKMIPLAEVKKHNSPDDLWVTIDGQGLCIACAGCRVVLYCVGSPNDVCVAVKGNVYDMTKFSRLHPGGTQLSSSMARCAGPHSTCQCLSVFMS